MEAILWKIRTGATWRDIPQELCPCTKNPDKNFDLQLYRNRHVIENLFAKLKHYKSIAMRADKLARNFKAVVTFTCTFLWLKIQVSK